MWGSAQTWCTSPRQTQPLSPLFFHDKRIKISMSAIPPGIKAHVLYGS